jgi:hypothetical protein
MLVSFVDSVQREKSAPTHEGHVIWRPRVSLLILSLERSAELKHDQRRQYQQWQRQRSEANGEIDEGGCNRTETEGKQRPKELPAPGGSRRITTAGKDVDGVDDELGDVASHHRGGSELRQKEPAGRAVYTHRRGSEQAGGHRIRRDLLANRLGHEAEDHEAAQQRELEEQSEDQRTTATALASCNKNPRYGDAGDECRESQEFEQYGRTGRISQCRADKDEVAGDVGSEQAKQSDEAQCVDITGQKAESGALYEIAVWCLHLPFLFSSNTSALRSGRGCLRKEAHQILYVGFRSFLIIAARTFLPKFEFHPQ